MSEETNKIATNPPKETNSKSPQAMQIPVIPVIIGLIAIAIISYVVWQA